MPGKGLKAYPQYFPMKGFRAVHGVPYYYMDEKLEFRSGFYIVAEDEKRVISREFRLPEVFSEEVREKGISPATRSIRVKSCYNPVQVKEGIKDYCERKGMNLILMVYPDAEVENEIIKHHMRKFYGMGVDFDPSTDFRRLKSLVKPSP